MVREDRDRLEKLESELAAYRAQGRLLESFVAMARSPVHGGLLTAALQTAVDVVSDLAGVEKGGLFLLDDEERVKAGILTRGEAAPETRSKLIGAVMTEGLAGWVVRTRKVGLVQDTETDDRWLTLPDQPYQVRSALAAPILRGGRLLGLVTLLHPEPDHFNNNTAELVRAACDQIGLTLENVELYEKVEAYSKALDAEMQKGRKIQRDFLPRCLPSPSGWEVAAVFEPTWQVSGDFYDVFELAGGLLGFVVADVSDKGVGAALFMALFRTLIRTFSGAATREKDDPPAPDEALRAVARTNNYMGLHHSEGGMFATLFMGVLDPGSGALHYVNAGHEPVFIRGVDGCLRRLARSGPAIGLVKDVNYPVGRDQLAPGEMVFGYTDGVTEARSVTGGLFTRARLEGLLSRPGDSAAGCLDGIRKALAEHAEGAAQSDDITMICLSRCGPSA